MLPLLVDMLDELAVVLVLLPLGAAFTLEALAELEEPLEWTVDQNELLLSLEELPPPLDNPRPPTNRVVDEDEDEGVEWELADETDDFLDEDDELEWPVCVRDLLDTSFEESRLEKEDGGGTTLVSPPERKSISDLLFVLEPPPLWVPFASFASSPSVSRAPRVYAPPVKLVGLSRGPALV